MGSWMAVSYTMIELAIEKEPKRSSVWGGRKRLIPFGKVGFNCPLIFLNKVILLLLGKKLAMHI